MSNLADKNCTPCRAGAVPLAGIALDTLLAELDGGWAVVDEHHLSKSFALADFAEGLALVNQIGEIAEEQAHHPDLYLAWGQVRVDVWSHSIDGLTESDFILCAKIDRMTNS
jgi:4a-hydroxytetrahydrobiopterin dehydratase